MLFNHFNYRRFFGYNFLILPKNIDARFRLLRHSHGHLGDRICCVNMVWHLARLKAQTNLLTAYFAVDFCAQRRLITPVVALVALGSFMYLGGGYDVT